MVVGQSHSASKILKHGPIIDSDRVIQVSYVLMVSDRCDLKERRVMGSDRETLLANSRMHPLHRVLNTQRWLKTLLG